MPLPTGRPHISDETPGPALAILAICSAGASALVAGSVVAYHLNHRHIVRGSKLDLEWNILLALALVVSITQSAITADQVQHGLGYPIEMFTPTYITRFLKLEYASNILYIASLLLLKGLQSLLQIVVTRKNPNYWALGITMSGMLAFLFGSAFQCNNPFWKLRDNQCIDQSAFWIAFGVFDIVTDLYSISTVLWISKSLKLRTVDKVKLLIVLASKYLPVACAIARLPFVPGAYNSPNYTIELYKLGVATQIQLHLSVMSLSMGKIFRFLNSLDVGYLSSSIEPTQGKGFTKSSRAAHYGYHSKSSKLSHSDHRSRTDPAKGSISEHGSSKGLVPDNYGRTITEVEGAIVPLIPGSNDVSMAQTPHHQQQQPQPPPQDMEDRHESARDGWGLESQLLGNEIRVTKQFEVRNE